MCGRFTQERSTSDLAEIFEAEDAAADAGGHYNVAPTDDAAVVVARSQHVGEERETRRAIVRYRWGLAPAWIDDPKIASRAFNARAEPFGPARSSVRHSGEAAA